MLPEVHGGSSDGRLRQLLARAAYEPKKIENMLQRVEARGCVYLPSINAFYVREFKMLHAAEEAARFLHHACRGLPLRRNSRPMVAAEPCDRFYARAIEHTLAYFGSRVLYPARPDEPASEDATLSPKTCKKLLHDALRGERGDFDATAQKLGYALGSELYNAYLRASVSRTVLRHWFLSHIEEPGEAAKTFTEILHKARSTRKKPCGSVTAR
jgi:hypothetical protein